MRESRIVAAIRGVLSRRRPFIWHIKHHGSEFSQRGVPDLLVCYRGLFLAFEVKTPEGQATKLQKVTVEEIRTAGGFAGFVRSASEVEQILKIMEEDMSEGPHELVALPALVAIANSKIQAATTVLSRTEVEDLVVDLGMTGVLGYADDGIGLEFTCSDYQLVALAAALQALVKARIAAIPKQALLDIPWEEYSEPAGEEYPQPLPELDPVIYE